jgi:hypothetical protein
MEGKMEALRLNRTIENDSLPELKQFIGQKVEIIILAEKKAKLSDNENSILTLKGSMRNIYNGLEFQSALRNEWGS